MKLYYVPKTRANRPRWVLEELGVPYELVRLDPKKGETRSPEHLARHPLGHVPVLEDGDLRMFESVAISLHLAEKFPQGKLLPQLGSPGRALAYQWIFFSVTELEPPLAVLSAQNRRLEAERDSTAIADVRERLRKAVAALDVTLSRRATLLAEGFSVADIIVAACLLWAKSLGALDDAPAAVKEYTARIGDRPARRRATAD
jgi:glutathione S-transferase